MQALFKIVGVLVIGFVALVLALWSPLLLLIFLIFETINIKRKPIETKKAKSAGLNFAQIISSVNSFKP